MAGGGAERVFMNLIHYCVDKGFTVDLILNEYAGPNLQYISKKVNIQVINSTSSIKSIKYLRDYMKREKSDIVFSTLSLCNFILILASILSFRKVKVIVREANSFLSQRDSWSFIKRFRDRIAVIILYRYASKIIVNSKGSKYELTKAALINGMRIEILPNSLDFLEIREKSNKPLPNEISSFLAGSSYYVSVGRLERAKGFDLLIEAFALSNSEKKLLIIGEGSHKKMLKILIEKHNLTNKILLVGYLDNPYPIINNSDAFVLSSRFEGMPNVLIEALSLYKSIISTDCKSGPREILVPNDFGIVVPVEDIGALAKALELPPNPPKKLAVERYIKRFDKELAGETFISLIYATLATNKIGQPK